MSTTHPEPTQANALLNAEQQPAAVAKTPMTYKGFLALTSLQRLQFTRDKLDELANKQAPDSPDHIALRSAWASIMLEVLACEIQQAQHTNQASIVAKALANLGVAASREGSPAASTPPMH